MAKQFKQQSVGVLGKCGDEEIRDDIQEKMDAFGQSMKSYAGINESMSLSSNPVELLKIHHKLCEPKFVQIEIKFIEDIGAVLRKCLDKDFIPIFEKMYKIILRAESVFCQSKDEDILNIISIQQNKSSIDTTCIQSLSSHFQSCITSSNEIIELAENPNSWKSFGFGFMDGGSKECGVYDTLQKCIVKIMEPCPDRSTPNLIKFIFQFVYKSVDCKSTQIVS
ncbi:unnamed protein product [Diamesa serratosioi]